MKNSYCKQPTLLIGLGGRGSNVVNNLYGEVYKENPSVEAFSIDVDLCEQITLEHIAREHCLNLSTSRTLIHMLENILDAREGFPVSHVFIQKNLPYEMSQIRGISSLIYRVALREGKLNPLISSVNNLAKKCDESNMMLRISIVTSLVGGTGSGIFLQLALLIKNMVKKNFPRVYFEIQGDFMLPGCFPVVPTLAEKIQLEANAYASLKEMDAVNKYLLGMGPEIQIEYEWNQSKISTCDIPYKCCFLYDEEQLNGDNAVEHIKNIMYTRLFGTESEVLHALLEEKINTNRERGTETTYATMSKDDILLVKLCELPKFEYETGQYYQSYKKVCGSQTIVLSPHLNTRWNDEIKDLGC